MSAAQKEILDRLMRAPYPLSTVERATFKYLLTKWTAEKRHDRGSMALQTTAPAAGA